MADVFPPLTLSALLSNAVRRPQPQPNSLIGLKVNPAPGSFAVEPEPQPEQLGPTMTKAALLDAPLPVPRPTDQAAQNVPLDQTPLPPARPGAPGQPLTPEGLFGTVQYNVDQRNPPVYTALNLGNLLRRS